MKTRASTNTDALGAQLAQRIASVVVDAMADYSHKTTGHKAQVITTGLEGLLDLIGAELHPYLAPLMREAATHPDLPEHARGLLSFAADHPGEGASLLRTAASLTGVGSSIGTLMSALVAPAIQDALRQVVTGLLDPSTLATSVVQGLQSFDSGMEEARRQNLSPSRFQTLVKMAENVPDAQTLGQLRNRGTLSEDTYRALLARLGIVGAAYDGVADLREQLLSPADLADMVVRGIKDEATATKEAEKSGVRPEDFAAMVAETGEPPATEQLLMLYRRGQLDRARLEHGIRQSRVKNEWINSIIDLQYAPPSAADALRGVVQAQLPEAEGRAKFAQAGLNPSEFDWMLGTVGRPPGIQQMIELWRRGYVTQADVEQAVRESDLKTKYLPAILKMREYRPPPRSVVALLHQGAIDDATAAKLLAQEGMPDWLIAVELKGAHHTKTAAARTLAQSTIVRLYHEQAIDRAAAIDMLHGIGWSTHDADFVLEVEDLHREAAAIERALSHVHSLYVGWRLNRDQAVASLAGLSVPVDQGAHLLSVWDLEREANRKQVPHGTITQALKYQIIDQPTAQAMLEAQGYSPFDAWVLISAALKSPQGPEPVAVTV